jgi:septal ring factor EnvC (AmiA/AmiB activator)
MITLVVLCCGMATAGGQVHRREPLTPLEIDQLRDTAMDPYARLKLFTHFGRARLTSLEQLRNDPKATDRGQQTHDRLQEFVDIYDELNENIDNFIQRKEDMRRPLKAVIEADNEFHAKLLVLKSAGDPASREAEQYRFLLDSALEAVGSGVQDHRQLLDEQEEAAKHRGKGKS